MRVHQRAVQVAHRCLLCASILFAVALAATSLHADMAPYVYRGFSIAPMHSSTIEMDSETVDFFIGEPVDTLGYRHSCRIHAVFCMLNATDSTIIQRVGFPIEPLRGISSGLHLYEFKVRVDGAEIGEIEQSKVKGSYFDARSNGEYVWCGWENAFRPGETTVEVEYNVVTNNDAQGMLYQNLQYCLYSGAYWKGVISSAILRIHLPQPAELEMILSGTTEGYKVDGSIASWAFDYFEPPRQDLVFHFIPPKVYNRIKSLRERVDASPNDTAARVALAREYLSTLVKGGGSREPWVLSYSRDTFYDLLASIRDQHERDFVAAHYSDTLNNGAAYCMLKASPPGDKKRIGDILAAIPYSMEETGWKLPRYCIEAERLLDGVLQNDPHNAYAWNVYLSNMYKMFMTAWGPTGYSSQNHVSLLQTNLIKKAHALCPDDRGISLWFDLITDENKPIPDRLGSLSRTGPKARVEVPLNALVPEARDVGTFWDLTDEETRKLLSVYEEVDKHVRTVAMNRVDTEVLESALVLKPGNVTDENRGSVIEILRSHGYWNWYYAVKIDAYNVSAGV